MWQTSQFVQLIEDAPSSSFADRFEWIIDKLSRDELSTICALLWFVWFCRNKRIFKLETLDPTVVVAGFAKQIEHYCSYAKNITQTRQQVELVASSWKPPHTSMFKANFDAHVNPAGEIGMCVVFRYDVGRIVAFDSKHVAARWDPTTTEVVARFALDLAHRLSFVYLVLEGDVVLVIYGVRKGDVGLAP